MNEYFVHYLGAESGSALTFLVFASSSQEAVDLCRRTRSAEIKTICAVDLVCREENWPERADDPATRYTVSFLDAGATHFFVAHVSSAQEAVHLTREAHPGRTISFVRRRCHDWQ